MQRHPHSYTREFHTFLASSKPFAWGSNDCCLYAADAIQSQTGVDIADDFRGKYSDKVSAFKLIKQIAGGTTVADAAAYCANKHGLPEYAYPLMAQRGDLAVFPNVDGELVAGVVHLNGRHLVSVGENGPVAISVTKIVRAWSVAGTHGHPKAFDKEAKTLTYEQKMEAHKQVLASVKAVREGKHDNEGG